MVQHPPALRQAARWRRNEWHGAIRCCTLGNNAVRHPSGNTVKKTGYKTVAGSRDKSILFFRLPSLCRNEIIEIF